MLFLKNLKIKKTSQKGRGVFAKKDIAPGTVIGDYLGKIILNREIDEKTQGLYDMRINDFFSILPDPKKEGVHLTNHSCEPNLGMYEIGIHTIFFALRKIFKGEELLVSYYLGPPEKKTCNPCTHECKCGSEFCKGTMHTSEKLLERYLAKVNKKTNKNIRLKQGVELLPLKKYPKTIADQPAHNLFANFKVKPIKKEGTRIPSIREARKMLREEGRIIEIPKCEAKIAGVIGRHLIVRPING